MSRKVLSLLIVISAILLSGCKLAVINVEGGEVQSTGSGTCLAGTVCMINVADTTFSETFTAVPDDGWYFDKWNSGGRFFCKDSFNPECKLSFEGLQGESSIEALVASSEVFYLMPVFKEGVGRPVTDTIIVNGREWAQVDLFTGLSWDEVFYQCYRDSGKCIGELNGYDMNGWTWASVDDVNALFNYYIGFDAVGPNVGIYSGYDNPNPNWAAVLFSDGWRPTLHYNLDDIFPDEEDLQGFFNKIHGWSRSTSPLYCIPDPCRVAPFWREDYQIPFGPGSGAGSYPVSTPDPDSAGAWFYRDV